MDKYEFNIKVEQIKKMVSRGDYETAMKIADTIDWHRVRNASLLSMIAEIYEKNKEYQEAKDILLLAFERAPIGKRLLYKLTDLALKEGNIAEAEAYHGPSLIIGYAPCEMHSIKGGMMHCQDEMKKAVACGYWNLFRFNPDNLKEGKPAFILDSKAPAGGYREFLMNEARYSRLTREFPERATELFERNEAAAKERYEHLLKLVELYK